MTHIHSRESVLGVPKLAGSVQDVSQKGLYEPDRSVYAGGAEEYAWCTTGVLLIVHIDSRCIVGVVHLGRGVHLGSLWVGSWRSNSSRSGLVFAIPCERIT